MTKKKHCKTPSNRCTQGMCGTVKLSFFVKNDLSNETYCLTFNEIQRSHISLIDHTKFSCFVSCSFYGFIKIIQVKSYNSSCEYDASFKLGQPKIMLITERVSSVYTVNPPLKV